MPVRTHSSKYGCRDASFPILKQAVTIECLISRWTGESVFRKLVEGAEAVAHAKISTYLSELGASSPTQSPSTLPSHTLDATQLLLGLGRLADLCKDGLASLMHWVLGRGTQHNTGGFIYHAGPQHCSVIGQALRPKGGTCTTAAVAAAKPRLGCDLKD